MHKYVKNYLVIMNGSKLEKFQEFSIKISFS